MFETEGRAKKFNQAKMQLVKLKPASVGINYDKLQKDKLYARKTIIKKGKDMWTYRQSKIFNAIGHHPNIIQFHGLIFDDSEP